MNSEEEILQESSNKIIQFKDKHKGQRCVIIGNGPSLNKMDLSFLKQEICFGMNKIYLGFEKWNFIPKYYVAVNSLVALRGTIEVRSNEKSNEKAFALLVSLEGSSAPSQSIGKKLGLFPQSEGKFDLSDYLQ